MNSRTENAPIIGETSIHTLDDLKYHRINEVAFLLAKLILEHYFEDDENTNKPWLFPQLLGIVKKWLSECLICKDNTFPQLLLLTALANSAVDRIYNGIIASNTGRTLVQPILSQQNNMGSTRYIDFDTTKPVFSTSKDKCHISHVVADTDSWEQKLAKSLEEMPEVVRYAKNHNLGFIIPYAIDGIEKQYIPDFIACIDDGYGENDLLNLIIEVTGERKREKISKVEAVSSLWVPAINNHGGFGRWAFIEIQDPWDAKNLILSFLKHGQVKINKEGSYGKEINKKCKRSRNYST